MSFILDYSIQDPHERTAFVKDLLNHYVERPTEAELEKLADYILCGRGDKPNPIERGEVIAPKARHNTFTTAAEHMVSLDAMIESSVPLDIRPWGSTSTARHGHPIQRPFRRADGTIDPGDSEIPGMRDLWDQIDKLEYRIKCEPTENVYNLYMMRHVLIGLQKQQYDLRDCMNQPITHSDLAPVCAVEEAHIDFSADSGYWLTEAEWRDRVTHCYNPRISRNIDDYPTKVTAEGTFVWWTVRKQAFDWENPRHVRALMENYDLLLSQDGECPDTQGYALLQDFQRYRKEAHLSEMRDYILGRRLEHASYGEIRAEIADKWGVQYNNSYLCRILTQELPRTIARAAQIRRLLDNTPASEQKQCPRCGRWLPNNKIFFGVRQNGDRLNALCRTCSRIMVRGSCADKRFKDLTREGVDYGNSNNRT